MTFCDIEDKYHKNCDPYSHPSCTAVILKCVMTWETEQCTVTNYCATESVPALKFFQFLCRK